MTEQSFQNQFLVALPALKGDYFEHSISLLVDHNDQGAFGLIINQPIGKELHDLFPDLEGPGTCPLLAGGPVDQNRIFFLHPEGGTFDNTLTVGPGIAMTTSPDILKAVGSGDAPAGTLALLGYAGWGAEQLEQELTDDVWLLTPSSADIVFKEPFETRPNAAAKLLGIDLNLIANRSGHD